MGTDTLNPPQDYTKVKNLHRRGLAANRPAADSVLIGTLYFSSDTLALERSNGTIWETYAGVGGGVGVHSTTHEPGGSDEIASAAWVTQPNSFLGDQIIDGDLLVTGTITPLTQEQKDNINQLIGDPTGSRMLMTVNYSSGLSLRHDATISLGRISCGNYDTQVYQPLMVESKILQFKTGDAPVSLKEHVRIHLSGGMSVGEGTDHDTDPGVGIIRARGLDGTPLNAANLTGSVPIPALPANIAYKDQANTFTLPQTITVAAQVVGLKIGGAANQPAFRPGITADTLEVVSADNTRYGPVNALNFTAIGGGSRFADLTVAGNLNVGSAGASNIELNDATLTGGNYFICRGVIYPGNVAVPIGPGSLQSSWYLAGHTSYGIYVNTGFYNEGGVYTNLVESRNHVRAVAGLYDYNRNTPIGVWTNFNPTILNGSLIGLYAAKWMVVGHTLWINLNIVVRPTGATSIGLYLQGMVNSAEYSNETFMYYDGLANGMGMAQCTPSDVWVYFYKSILANVAWAGDAGIIGTICIPIQ